MKHSTSVRNAMKVAERVRAVNGILATPYANYAAVRIRRVWLFGSTVQGKDQPNDTDIVVEWATVGEHRLRDCGKVRHSKRSIMNIKFAVQAKDELHNYLRGHLKMVRIHDEEVDGSIAHPRVLIYPRNDWNGQVLPTPERIDLGEE